MFERFTDSARRVIVLASEESKLLGHHFIGTEHLLLGVLHQGPICDQLPPELNLTDVRRHIIEFTGEGDTPPSGHIPFTVDCKQALVHSNNVATQLGDHHTGLIHLTLAVLRMAEKENQAATAYVLRQLGINPGELRERITPAAKLNSATPAPSIEAEPEPPTAQEILIEEFVGWYTKSGNKRFGPDHPVSRLYDLLADQPDS